MSSGSVETTPIALPKGDALAAHALKVVTGRDETSIVLLAGPVGCGKTTIVVGLYELFNEGPVGGLLFGGSVTLAGFERICHWGRTASGGAAPETIRTNPSSGAAFLHLRVVDTSTGIPKSASILISDVTGEAFDEARDVSEPTIIPRPIWQRADVICLALDGERLATTTKRQVVRSGARSLLRAARESRLISKSCRLAVVTTKWDLITSSETEEFVAETESLLREQYGPDFQSISFHRIAARPTSSRVPYAYGLPGLLTEWISRIPSKPKIAVPAPDENSGLSDFAHLFWEKQRTALLGELDVI
jgi:hypothetical protein